MRGRRMVWMKVGMEKQKKENGLQRRLDVRKAKKLLEAAF
jgi:hypothetical protein